MPDVAQPSKITREQLEELEKSQLIDLLIVSLQAQELSTSNMQRLNNLMEQASSKINELESKNTSQEAELLALRAQR